MFGAVGLSGLASARDGWLCDELMCSDGRRRKVAVACWCFVTEDASWTLSLTEELGFKSGVEWTCWRILES